MSYPALQTPFDLSSPSPVSPPLTLKHRIVLAPMTRMRASATGVINTATAATYYSERATPGGLLISEGTIIDDRARGFPNTPGLWNDEQVEAWKGVTESVKKEGGVFWAQIWHVGRVSVPSQINGRRPLASTKVPLPGKHVLFGENNSEEEYVGSEAMTEESIKEVVEQFARAARNAIRAGFDGVEIHGGNGYLLDTFVHDNINDRKDRYGGSLENRLRFPLEVVDAVVTAVGNKRAAIRIAPFHILQQTLDSDRVATFSRYAEELEKRQLAYVHLVEPRYDQLSTEGAFSGKIQRSVVGAGGHCSACEVKSTTQPTEKMHETYSLWTFRKILKNTPLIGAGGYDARIANEAVSDGKVDLVAFGRHFTSNPDLVDRLLDDIPLTKYDRRTFYTPGMEGYLGWKNSW